MGSVVTRQAPQGMLRQRRYQARVIISPSTTGIITTITAFSKDNPLLSLNPRIRSTNDQTHPIMHTKGIQPSRSPGVAANMVVLRVSLTPFFPSIRITKTWRRKPTRNTPNRRARKPRKRRTIQQPSQRRRILPARRIIALPTSGTIETSWT